MHTCIYEEKRDVVGVVVGGVVVAAVLSTFYVLMKFRNVQWQCSVRATLGGTIHALHNFTNFFVSPSGFCFLRSGS